MKRIEDIDESHGKRKEDKKQGQSMVNRRNKIRNIK